MKGVNYITDEHGKKTAVVISFSSGFSFPLLNKLTIIDRRK